MTHFSYWKVLTRRKTLKSDSTDHDNKLSRVMGTFDLTALGIGATLGVGVYVLAGHVARDQAGPSVVLSFAIAAITSLFAGLCYAEFGARVPKAGSAYIYSYVCIGEFAAFIIGWNLILEYIIGSASVSKGISLYLDTLINDTLKNTFMEVTPIKWGFLGMYFDWFAFAAAFSFGACLAFGIHTSTIINNCFTILNIIIVLVVVIAGSFKADIKNWQIDPSTVNATADQHLGTGGFFPFGFEGTLKGAATCFFGFVGFDCIATTGEEVKDPQRAIPKSILFTLLTIFLAYFSVATVLTLMWPYYAQDVNAPLPYVFQEIGWPALKWIVTIGGMIGLIASLFGAMFPLPRIIYAMSQDGLVFKYLGKVSTRFKTPVAGTICAALLAGLMSALFELTQLVNMLSIGTLLAYTVVAISITILRFMDNSTDLNETGRSSSSPPNEGTFLSSNQTKITPQAVLKQIINFKRLNIPTDLSTRIVGTILFFYCLCCLSFSLVVMYLPNEILSLEPWALGILGTLSVILVILIVTISIQPREEVQPGFKVPLVPLIPSFSIFINIYLMLQLDIYTWIRFGIWMIIGLLMYFTCFCIYKRGNVESESLTTVVQIKHPSNDSFNNLKHQIITNGILPHELSITSTLENGSMKRSLDDIIPESEIRNNHKEIKNPNGKTFFIENLSLNDPERGIDEDEAKSAIAILDDILSTEESVMTVHDLSDFIRKTSVDSAMIPSFIEASTVAMVHKSCENLPEEENENWIEDEINVQTNDGRDFIIVNHRTDEDIISLNKPKEEEKKTEKPVELSCEHLTPNQSNNRELDTSDSQEQLVGDQSQLKDLNRSPSLKSNDYVDEDPVHSEKFKTKLSRLIVRPRILPVKHKQDEGEDCEINKILSDTIKPSGSDSDIKSPSQNESTENGAIPRAPEFDPVLYRTLGRRNRYQKPISEIDANEIKLEIPSTPSDSNPVLVNGEVRVDDIEDELNIPTLPFKQQLEALLKRGPSYRVTKGLSPLLIDKKIEVKPENIENKSNSDIKLNQNQTPFNEHKDNFNEVLKTLRKGTKTFPISRPATIEDAFKKLKPVTKLTTANFS